MKNYKEQDVIEVIRRLERDLLSGGEMRRWKAAAELGEFVENAPDRLWPLVLRHGSSDDEDLRSAIAACILEHLLEHHFDEYFPLIESEVSKGNTRLKDTLALCAQFGQAELPENVSKWEKLMRNQS